MERLLEREADLEALAELAREAAAGRGGVALVAGEAGIGKSALLRALAAGLPEGVGFVIGACEPLSVPVPLAPLRELVERAGAADPAGAGAVDRLAFVRAVAAALAAVAPAVAAIEDAHWADPLTIDVIRLLARRMAGSGIALVVTYRDDETAANRELGLLLGDLAARPDVRRVRLDPLGAGAVRELAGPAGLDPVELVRATGGNPFLVVETVAAGGGLPASVRDAALARAGRLGREARAVVDLAAVIGTRIPSGLLESLRPGAEAVEEALARGVLVDRDGTLGFRHELIREAVESSISPPRRAELHREVLGALEQRPERVDSARLAHHAELGGLVAAAGRHAMRAAGEAERRGALREVRLQAQRALRNGEELADEERFELLLRLSRAANFASERIEEGMAAAEQAVELGERLGDTARQSEALIRLAWAMWSLDRVVEALAAAERAAELLADGGDPAGLARARSTVVRMEATAFDPAAAIAGGPDALALAAAAGLDDVCIDVEISVALAHGHHGDPHALDLLTAALARARAAGLPIQSVRACVNLMFVASLLRAHDAADRAMAEAREVFGEYDTPIPERAAESFLARSMLDRGSWDEALAAAARADEGWHGELAVARTVVALVAARRGVPGAVEGLAGVQRELVGVAESSRHAMLRLAQVEEAWLRGDLAACREHLAAAWSSPATTRFARPAGELAVWSMRLSRPVPAPPRASAPVLAELSGDWRAAIRLWTQAGAPYEAALAALAGDDRAARDALSALHRLGAGAAARAFLRCRAAAGAAAVRGPRRSTLANPAGLTRREQEVLERVAGGATNAGVAAALHLSERTVAHHVSAILGKLGAPNRLAAVERARSRGLLP